MCYIVMDYSQTSHLRTGQRHENTVTQTLISISDVKFLTVCLFCSYFCFVLVFLSFMDMRARQRLTTYILSFVTLQTFCMHKKLCKMLNGILKIVKIDMAKQDISGLKQF